MSETLNDPVCGWCMTSPPADFTHSGCTRDRWQQGSSGGKGHVCGCSCWRGGSTDDGAAGTGVKYPEGWDYSPLTEIV